MKSASASSDMLSSIGSIMPTRPIMLGKDKVVDRANRLIVVSDRG